MFSRIAALFFVVSFALASCSGIVSVNDEPTVPSDQIVSGQSSGHSSEGD